MWLRSTGSRYLDAKACERAAAGKQLGGHACSKLQLLELWRWALQRAHGYSTAEAQLHKVASLVREIRQRRGDAHNTAQASEVRWLWLTCSTGPAGGRRRAAVTAEEAVRFCPSLAELGQKGKGSFTAAGVRELIRQAKAEVKAAEARQKDAERDAAAVSAEAKKAHAAKKTAAAADLAAQRQAAQRAQGIAQSDVRTSRMWASAPHSDSDEESDDDDDEESDDDDEDDEDDEDDDDDDVEMGEGEGDNDDALGRAIQDEAAELQQSAEQRAAAASVEREGRQAVRAEAAEERRRLMVRCLQKRTVVNNYWGKQRVPLPQRTPARLQLEAPREVQIAFEELQQLEAQQRALHV